MYSLRDEYSVLLSCHLSCSSCAIFEAILLNVRHSLSVSVDFGPLYLFADVVFPWFVYAYTTLGTVALDAPNNVAGFITDAPAKRAQTLCPLSKSDKSSIFLFFHMDCHSTHSPMHWYEHYRV
jgi:hypothetical protein